MKFLRIATISLAACAAAFSAESAKPSKTVDLSVTYQEATAYQKALGALDGYSAGLDADKHAVTVPYAFPGHLRGILSDDITAISAIVSAYTAVGPSLAKQVGVTMGQKMTDEQVNKVNALFNDAAVIPKKVTLELVSDADLDIDHNPIPGSVLSALKPIRIP